MRFTYLESMCDPTYHSTLARAAEAAGYHGYAVPDSICYPAESDTSYPYTPDGKREFLEDKPFLEPMSIIPALAAVTSTLKFTTFVIKLAIREPVLMAKSMTTVAVLSNNRLVFGVGLSPWPEDFAVCNQPWPRRGKRMDEMIEILRGLGTPGFFSYDGEFYQVPSIKLCPVPTLPVPILIGGHSDPALRRAARLGDGWVHAGGDEVELSGYLKRLSELRSEYGRQNEPFEIHAISLDGYTPDGVRRLEDLGVTDLAVGFRDSYTIAQDTESLEDKVAALEGYAESVIAKV